MNENINLCEILKGHEGETFYSPAFGRAYLVDIDPNSEDKLTIHIETDCDFNYYLSSDGKFDDYGECMLFPSKDQRDWNKWAKEQKPKAPKTWRELLEKDEKQEVTEDITGVDTYQITAYCSTESILKSAVALLKIHQLIEKGYGGSITKEEWLLSSTIKWTIKTSWNSDIIIGTTTCFNAHIAFHTHEQAKEFLSYPENVQLIKDFYMI